MRVSFIDRVTDNFTERHWLAIDTTLFQIHRAQSYTLYSAVLMTYLGDQPGSRAVLLSKKLIVHLSMWQAGVSPFYS